MKTFVLVLLFACALAVKVSDESVVRSGDASDSGGRLGAVISRKYNSMKKPMNKKKSMTNRPKYTRWGRIAGEVNCSFKFYKQNCRMTRGFMARYRCFKRGQRVCKCTVGAYLKNCRKTKGYAARFACYNRGLRNCSK